MASYFTLGLVKSCVDEGEECGNLSTGGLISFGKFTNASFSRMDLIHCVVIGIIGGCVGILFNNLNIVLTKFRVRAIYNKYWRAVETVAFAIFLANVSYLMMNDVKSCNEKKDSPDFLSDPETPESELSLKCEDGDLNTLSNLRKLN